MAPARTQGTRLAHLKRCRLTTTGDHAHIAPRPGARASLEEALRREGVQPIRSADDLVCDGIFDTDEELSEFLQFTYAARRADMALSVRVRYHHCVRDA